MTSYYIVGRKKRAPREEPQPDPAVVASYPVGTLVWWLTNHRKKHGTVSGHTPARVRVVPHNGDETLVDPVNLRKVKP